MGLEFALVTVLCAPIYRRSTAMRIMNQRHLETASSRWREKGFHRTRDDWKREWSCKHPGVEMGMGRTNPIIFIDFPYSMSSCRRFYGDFSLSPGFWLQVAGFTCFTLKNPSGPAVSLPFLLATSVVQPKR